MLLHGAAEKQQFPRNQKGTSSSKNEICHSFPSPDKSSSLAHLQPATIQLQSPYSARAGPLSPRSSFELPANGWDSICTFSFRIPIFLSQEIRSVKSTELSVNHNWSGDSGGNMKARTTCIDRVQGMGANVYTQSTKPAHSL
jgi:hypothetical protein